MDKGKLVLIIIAILFVGLLISQSSLFSVASNEVNDNPKLDDSLKDNLQNNFFSVYDNSTQTYVLIETKNNLQFLDQFKIDYTMRMDEFNLLAGKYSEEDILKFSNSDLVIKIYYDEPIESYLLTSINDIRASPAIDLYHTRNELGKGAKVCVLDDGIDDYNPYIGKIPADHIKIFTGEKSYYSDSGHGTHVSGIIIADYTRNIKNKEEIQGVAPAAELYFGKVESSSFAPRMSVLLEAIRWCVEDVKADVISMSVGGAFPYGPDGKYNSGIGCKVVDELYKKGNTVIVAASSNSGHSSNPRVPSPAACDSVIAVTATYHGNNKIAGYSTPGAEIDITAVGDNVLSTVKGGLETMRGSSMAAPHVAGAVAVLRSIKPSATKEEIKNALYKSAIKLNESKTKQGNGALDVYGACEVLLTGKIPSQNKKGIKCGSFTYNMKLLSSGKFQVNTKSWIKYPFYEDSGFNPNNYFSYKRMKTFSDTSELSYLSTVGDYILYLKDGDQKIVYMKYTKTKSKSLYEFQQVTDKRTISNIQKDLQKNNFVVLQDKILPMNSLKKDECSSLFNPLYSSGYYCL